MKKQINKTIKLLAFVFLLTAFAFNAVKAQTSCTVSGITITSGGGGPLGTFPTQPGYEGSYNNPGANNGCSTAAATGTIPWTGKTVPQYTGYISYTFSSPVTSARLPLSSVNWSNTFSVVDSAIVTVNGGGTVSLSNPCNWVIVGGNRLGSQGPGDGYGDAWITVTSTTPFTVVTFTCPNTLVMSGFLAANPCSITGIVAASVACTAPTALSCDAATTITAGGTATSTVTGGAGGNITWAVSPTAGVSTTSGSGSSTGALTFANAGTYTVTFTSTNNSSPAGCTPAASVTCSRTITVNASPVTLGTVANITGAVGSTLTGNVPTVSGGTAPYTYSSGIGMAGCTAVPGATALPAGNLGAVNSSTGAHTVNTTGLAAGTYYYCLRVCDNSGTNCSFSSHTVNVTAAACGAGTTAPVIQ